jgi:tetratricopeptide (TPR) repeat protein
MSLIAGNAPAATQQDKEIELTETTYRVTGDDSAEIDYHQRWKALTAQGRADISQFKIPYVPGFADVEIKFIKTIKKNGSVVDGDPNSAFDTGPSQEPLAPVFDDTKYRTILPPNLETGDAVEYEAVVHIHKWPKSGDFWFIHYLSAVPVLSEIVVLDLPADRKVTFYEDSKIPGKTEISNGRRIERWTSANTEPAKAGLERATPLFAVSSISSWDAFGEWVHSLNEEAAKPTPDIKKLAAELVANKSSDKDRIAALYAYVATKVRYVSISFGIGRIQPHTASVVLNNAFGDCKDQTALLTALLSAAGFKTYAVLVLPGAGVVVPDVPTPDQFNHEFTAVDTESGLQFLDTSMGPVQPGLLQPGVRGRRALIIGDKTASVIDIPLQSPVPQRIAIALKGKITASGAFEGSTRLDFQGFAEPVLRRVFLDATNVEKENVVRQLAGPEFNNANVRQVSSSYPDDLTGPFWVQCELSDKDFFPLAKPSMDIKLEWPPAVAALLKSSKPSQPVPMESMSVFMSMDLIVDTSLTIGNGMPVHLKTPFGTMDSEFSYRDGHLLLKRSFQLNSGTIAPEDWDAFVSFMRAAEDATSRGFALDRHSGSPITRSSSPAQPSPLARFMQESSESFNRRDYESAKRSYLEVVKLDPQSRVAWNALGRTFAALHEYEEAERAYKRQIEINPEDPYAYNNLGLLYRATKRQDDAIASFRKQIKIVPRDRFAHENLSFSLEAQKHWDAAREEASIAADIAPEDPAKWVQLGKLQIKSDRIQDARNSFDRALAQVHDAMVENNIAYELADAGLDLDKAWGLVSGALDAEARLACEPEDLSIAEAAPKNDMCGAQLRRLATVLDTAGWTLYRQGRLTDADPYLSSAYAIVSGTLNELHLSTLLARMGRVDESLKHFANARSRDAFSRLDSGEARRELAKALGGEAQLDSRLEQIQTPEANPSSTPHVVALVDGHGKVLEAQSTDMQTPGSLISETKTLTLTPISWPEHSLSSIRTIEFAKDGARFTPIRSYVGQAPGS